MRKLTLMAIMAMAIGAGSWTVASAADAAVVEVSFSPKEKQVITDFYAGNGSSQDGKGKSKTKDKGGGNQRIPPGIAKKGGALPPGIAKRKLPSGLVSQLPPPPTGFERVIVDKDVLLVNIATRVVHDVLERVLD